MEEEEKYIPKLEKGTIHWARVEEMHRAVGVFVEEQEGERVEVSQRWLHNGLLYNQEELTERARSLYPDKSTKIIANTFAIPLEEVTAQWIREQMDLNGLKPIDLVRNLGIGRSEVSLFLNAKQKMSRAMRSMFFYYFLSLEHKRTRIEERVTASELAEALALVRERKSVRAQDFGRTRREEEQADGDERSS